jgi:hypothetical protein
VNIIDFGSKNILLLTAVATILAACGGGGGGSGGSSAASFNTTEFQANYGLASINALTAYGSSGTGSGITVAVLDTGIDQTHTELTGNTSASSASVGSIVSSVQDTNGHGTQVAGIIAAAKNSVDTHGVAFNSTLLAVKVSDDGTATVNDMAAGVDFAVAQGAKVINLSFTSTAFSTTLATSVQAAVNAGVIVVAASGNDANSQADQVARLANCEGASNCTAFGSFDAKGLMLAVGATDSSNAIASFSNLAGDTGTAFLVAPGVGIVTTANGGGTVSVNGTSFSAPHVSGAVAIILQRFPSLTAAQAVNLLLTSATDLGATGTDTTFGVGLLNLQAAFSAQGAASIPMAASVKGASVALASSKVMLGSAFGDALSDQGFLAEAIILDAYQRAYIVDLRNRIVAGTATLEAMSFLQSTESTVVEAPTPDGLTFDFDVSGAHKVRLSDQEMGFAHHVEGSLKPWAQIGALRFSADLTRQTTARLALRSSPLALFGENVTGAISNDLFFNTGWTSAPQLSMLGRGSSLSLSKSIDRQTSLNVGFHQSGGADQSDTGRGYLGQARVSHGFDNGLRLGIGAGYVGEKGAMFRSTSSGAFGRTEDNHSQYYSLSAAAPLAKDLTVFASYTEATAQPSFSGDSLFSNWGRVQANAFSVGIARQSAFAAGDKLGLTIGQPLRVHRSKADLTLPTGRDLDGNVTRTTKRVDLEPTGRQMNIQLAWRGQVGAAASVRAFSTLSLQPGHDREARPEVAVGLKWGMNF